MQKLYYSISEVAEIIDEEAYILRYWEKEFNQISPKKNKAGNRIYSENDLNIIKIVKKLLRDDKHSIQGAKEQLPKILNSSRAKPIEQTINFDVVSNNSNSNNVRLIEIIEKYKATLSEIKDLAQNL